MGAGRDRPGTHLSHLDHPRGTLAEAKTRTFDRRWSLAAIPVAFVALMCLQLERQAGHPPWDTIFAEDGPVFFARTTRVSDLVKPYAGYLPLAGRIIGLGGHAVPLEQLARYFTLAGAVVTTLCAFAVWQFAVRFVPSRWLRAVLALSVVLLPTVVYEQLGNGVNTLWAILFAGWWALIDRPRTWKGALPAAVTAAIAVLSSALAGLFFPFVLALAWKRRAEPYRAVAAAYVIALALQAVAVLSVTQMPAGKRPTPGELPLILSMRLLGSALIGEQLLTTAWEWFGVGFAVVAAVVVLGILTWLTVRSTGEGRLLGVASVVYGFLAYLVVLLGRGATPIGDRYAPNSTRYQSLAIWLMLSGLVLLASASTFTPRARHILNGAIVAWFAVTAIAGFRVVTPRSDPPMTWTTSVARAREACQAGAAPFAIVVVVPTTFDFSLRCDDVVDR